jgi:hypothetical protein
MEEHAIDDIVIEYWPSVYEITGDIRKECPYIEYGDSDKRVSMVFGMGCWGLEPWAAD